jgi:hypothetical protein
MQMKAFSLLLLVCLAACPGGASGDTGRRAPQEAFKPREIRPVEASRRLISTEPLWPAGTRRLQIMVTPAWAPGEHLVWLVSGGTNVLQVIRTEGDDLNKLLGRAFGDLALATQESPTASLWFGGAGSLPKPPTPDPPPAPILPPGYVDAMMRIAGQLNTHVMPEGAAGP